MLLCLQDHYRNQMDNKENLGLTIGVDKNIDKSFTNTIRMSIKPSNICSMVTELDAQKEYLAKLKIQRQKTEKLHAEYLKLKKQKQKMKEQSQNELNSTKSKLIECQAQVNKKIEDVRFLERQIQKFKVQIDKINRQKTENINSLKFSFEKSFTQMKLSMESLAENLESKNRQINSLKKSHSLKVTDLQNQKAQLENASRNMQQKLKQSQQKRRQSENLVTILTKKLEDSNSQASRNRNESQQKNKQISTLKSTNQRLQLDQQVSSRKLNDLQLQLHQSEQKMLEMQRQKQKYRSKLEQSEQRSRDWKQEVQKIKKECSQLKCLYSVLKDQNMRKQETIKQYSSKMMNRQDEEIWRQRLSQKENENDQLLDIIRNLKEENDQLLSFIKQKQLLQRQRRSLVEYQMEEICKFENLLKDVK